jgi:Glycerol dehydrogenase and related enzymes
MLPLTLQIAPAQVIRGRGILAERLQTCSQWLVIGGERAIAQLKNQLSAELWHKFLVSESVCDCTPDTIHHLQQLVQTTSPNGIVAVGGGKVQDTAKLIAHECHLPIITIPSSAGTCASWTALSNVYGDRGEFLYDVPLSRCPDLMLVDYDLIATAPVRTLVAGIGDAIAKWYEASVSSGSSSDTLTISAVQSARVLRDILFQKAEGAIADPQPSNALWREVVDANLCMAGMIGGLGGANCRTVAAHAIHNALTHLPQAKGTLHGEKVAYGILVQLRLEEMQGNQLASSARQQLLKFYSQIGLPKSLRDLGLSGISLSELEQTAAIACNPNSDIHRLPFPVSPELVLSAMVSVELVRHSS